MVDFEGVVDSLPEDSTVFDGVGIQRRRCFAGDVFLKFSIYIPSTKDWNMIGTKMDVKICEDSNENANHFDDEVLQSVCVLLGHNQTTIIPSAFLEERFRFLQDVLDSFPAQAFPQNHFPLWGNLRESFLDLHLRNYGHGVVVIITIAVLVLGDVVTVTGNVDPNLHHKKKRLHISIHVIRRGWK